MRWNCIGQSVAGSSHISSGRPCEDALSYEVITAADSPETLIVCVCDGAGSALRGGEAAASVAKSIVEHASKRISENEHVTEGLIQSICAAAYEELAIAATQNDLELPEYACTVAGAILQPDLSAFFQIGDGAIITLQPDGVYYPVWWPENGEYLNTTNFLTDDVNLTCLKIVITETGQTQVSIFTDGLQMLALNNELKTGHTPFFAGLFPSVVAANTREKEIILNQKLAEYLQSEVINERTDDDKTLFLAAKCMP